MRQTPVNDYLEEISTELPEELYGYLSDAVYETVCEFDEEVDQLKAENAKLREAFAAALIRVSAANEETGHYMDEDFCCMLRELGVEVDE